MKFKQKKNVPLYEQVTDNIRAEISSGKLKPQDRLDSHKILAKKYGVSLITIKRALSDLATEGVVYSRGRVGTYVEENGSRKSSIRSSFIGLVLEDLKSPFFSLIVQNVEAYASRKGYHLLLSNSSSQPDKEETLIRRYFELGVSGLIVASMSHEYTASHFLQKINEEQYPLIMVSYIKDPDMYYVGTDHEEGGYIATRHLIQMGYQKLGFVNGEPDNAVGELRKNGFMRALKEHDLPVREEFMYRLSQRGEWHDFSSGYEIGEKFVNLARKPEAMFIYNDLSALGFEQAVLDHGLSIPDDVAIVGFDGIERGQYAPVPLTTIQQPFTTIGSVAVENLIKRIEGQPVNTKTVLEPKIVIRESCGARNKNNPDSLAAASSQADNA